MACDDVLSLKEIGGAQFDETGLSGAFFSHAVDEAESPEGESLLEWISIQLLFVQRQLDLLLGLKSQLAICRYGHLDASLLLRSDSLLYLFIAFGVEHDANGPGALPLHAVLVRCTQLTVGLGVKHGGRALSLSQCPQIVVDHGLHLLFGLLVVDALKIDEAVTHLSVVGASRRLQLDLHVVHHDDLLA